MAAELLLPLARVTDANANPYSGAKWHFYATGTTTPQEVYGDAGLSVSLGSTVTADSGGKFVPIYFDSTKAYRGVCENASGSVTLHDIDPINSDIFTTLSLSSNIVFLPAGTGAVSTTVQAKLREWVSVKDFGATGNGSANDHTAFDNALSVSAETVVPVGTYKIGTAKLGEYAHPLVVRGSGRDTEIIPDNPDKTAFRVGGVGGNASGDGVVRAITRFEGLTFKPPSSASAPYAYTGFDLESTFPLILRDDVFQAMGPDAIKLTGQFYGAVETQYLVNSGLTCENVNSLKFDCLDIRADEFNDVERDEDGEPVLDGDGKRIPLGGATLFGNVGRYPIELISSDNNEFIRGTVEGWKVPAALIRGSHDTVFANWWEGNRSTTHVIKMEQAPDVLFTRGRIDCGEPYTNSFILVQNNTPLPSDEAVNWRTVITLRDEYLLLTSVPFGDAGKLVAVTNGETVIVRVEDVKFWGGSLWGDRTVEFDVRAIQLKGGLKHNFYSKPNALRVGELNTWMPESLSADWDFGSGANLVTSDTLSITTTTTAGEFLTGTTAAKITGFADGTTKAFSRQTTGEMGAIASGSGKTYAILARLKFDRDVSLKIDLSNDDVTNYANTPTIPVKGGVWLDYFIKTSIADTQALGTTGTPRISFTVTNASGGAATAYLDFLEYQICTGDFVV